MKENKPKTIIVHHTAVKSSSPQLKAVESYHASLGFPVSSTWYHVGYHWFIERSGTTTRTRNDKEEGAHTLGGWNTKSIGICLAGDFNIEEPTEEQLLSLRRLIDGYGFKVLLHREAQTDRTCPGERFVRHYVDKKLRLGLEDEVKCKALKKKIREQQSLIEQLLAFIVSYFK